MASRPVRHPRPSESDGKKASLAKYTRDASRVNRAPLNDVLSETERFTIREDLARSDPGKLPPTDWARARSNGRRGRTRPVPRSPIARAGRLSTRRDRVRCAPAFPARRPLGVYTRP